MFGSVLAAPFIFVFVTLEPIAFALLSVLVTFVLLIGFVFWAASLDRPSEEDVRLAASAAQIHEESAIEFGRLTESRGRALCGDRPPFNPACPLRSAIPAPSPMETR